MKTAVEWLKMFIRKYIYCNHKFIYVYSTHCYKCNKKVRLTWNEYWNKKFYWLYRLFY